MKANMGRCAHCGRFCAIDGAKGKGQSGLYLIADEDGTVLDWQSAICMGCLEKHDLPYWEKWISKRKEIEQSEVK